MEDDWKLEENNPLEDFDDEDDSNVKDCWEDEDEEKNEEIAAVPTAAVANMTLSSTKSNKKAARSLKTTSSSEKDSPSSAAVNNDSELTEEEKAAERMRKQLEHERQDLRCALETTFEKSSFIKIDECYPFKKDDFEKLNEALDAKFKSFNTNKQYYTFVEQHIRNICASLSSTELKNIRVTVGNLCTEKQKLEAAEKAKKSKIKTKTKASLKLNEDKIDDFSKYDDYGDDDFM